MEPGTHYCQKRSTSVSKITLTAPGIMTQSGPLIWAPSVPMLQQPAVNPELIDVIEVVGPDLIHFIVEVKIV